MDNDFNAIGSFFTGLISIFTLLINMICLLLVLKYYKGLTMLKRLTEEVVIPIPYRSVSNRFLSIPKFVQQSECLVNFLFNDFVSSFRCHSISAKRICTLELVDTSIFYRNRTQTMSSKFAYKL